MKFRVLSVREKLKKILCSKFVYVYCIYLFQNGKANSAIVVGCFEDLKLSSVGRQVDKQCEDKLTNLLQ